VADGTQPLITIVVRFAQEFGRFIRSFTFLS
jgi:hypothetical protein